MNERKNQTRLQYKDQDFTVYQDRRDSWHFSFLHLTDVDTQHKELQPALNEVYSTIDDLTPRNRSQRIPDKRQPDKRQSYKKPLRGLDLLLGE